MKVKVSLIHPLFSNMEGGWQRHRSCGVVRSIMSPSRGDDPGSNPGTSTKHVIGINPCYSPIIEVDKEELLIISATSKRMRAKSLVIVLIFLGSILSGCTGSDTEKDERIEALEAELADSISDNDDDQGKNSNIGECS